MTCQPGFPSSGGRRTTDRPPDVAASDSEGEWLVYAGVGTTLSKSVTDDLLSRVHDVRRRVAAATSNRQVTWDSSSITGNFYFRPPPAK